MAQFASGDRGAQFKRLLDERKDIPGDLAEFGVYEGGNTINLASSGRKVWAFDTFQGMPKEEFDSTIDHDEPGKFKPNESPEMMFRNWPNIIPVKGRFCDTLLTTWPASTRIVLAYLDADLYVSTRQVLLMLPTFLTPNAILVVDDYGACKGVVKAVDEFCARWGVQLVGDEIKWNPIPQAANSPVYESYVTSADLKYLGQKILALVGKYRDLKSRLHNEHLTKLEEGLKEFI